MWFIILLIVVVCALLFFLPNLTDRKRTLRLKIGFIEIIKARICDVGIHTEMRRFYAK